MERYEGKFLGTTAIQEMPTPQTEKEVRGFLGRLNYIARFISHLTATCEPIFKLLKKDQVVRWNDECQAAFEVFYCNRFLGV